MACNTATVFVILVALSEVVFRTVGGHRIVYVDTENGTLSNSCWKGGPDLPCRSLELGLEGAKKHDTKVAILVSPYNNTADISAIQSPTEDNDNSMDCPPGFTQSSSSNSSCKCANTFQHIVRCNDSLQESSILDCYSMTYSQTTGTVMGASFYGCFYQTSDYTDPLYQPLPHTNEELNNITCGRLNRDGQLCGKCKDGYNPPVYSYDLHCTNCTNSRYAWIKYIAVAYIPLTVFFILVMCFRISATSPKMYAFVTVSQAITVSPNMRAIQSSLHRHPEFTIPIQILATLYSIWNLDFFRMILPQICLKVNTLQSLALDYTIPFYPLVLLTITYLLIKLHDNFRLDVRPWKLLVQRCFVHFKRHWDVKTSIIDAFATFFFLSGVRLLTVSFDLLVPTRVYHANGSVVGLYLYYDATVKYFGREHLPYAILALAILLFFVLLPLLLLLLYPMRCFQQCLGLCGVRWHALHTFINAFQGCYKDGTSGTRDCRYFAALYLIIRIALFIAYAITLNVLYYILVLVILIVFAMLNTAIQPYKQKHSVHNAIDTVLILTFAVFNALILGANVAVLKDHKYTKVMLVLAFFVAMLPLLYITFIVLHWLWSRCKAGQRCIRSFQAFMCTWRLSPDRSVTQSQSDNLLPDRLINSEEYDMNPSCSREDKTDDVENYSNSNQETAY